jgi:hypothetical protein
MLNDFKYLERKYKHLFPDYELLQIEEIALPVAKVKVQVLGQVVTETTPITEFLLRFISLGVDNPTDLAETLGLSLDLVLDEIAEEIRQGRVKRGLSDKLILTSLGNDVRTSAAVRMPKKLSIEFIFDKGTFKLKNWEKHLFISSSDLKEISKNMLKSFEQRKKTIKLDDIEVLEINRIFKEEAKKNVKNSVEILNIQKVLQRRHGFRLGRIMIYYKNENENGFIVLVGNDRSPEHEDLIRARGGLKALDIKITPPVPNSIQMKPEAIKIVERDSPFVDDGKRVMSFEHRPILLDALENTNQRLMIISPWITRAVVNDSILRQLESLLRRKVLVTIAFGFFDSSNPKETDRRDDSRILRNLLELSRKYINFEFRWMGMTADKAINHSKIFVSDSIYIAGSFNWLSFRGDTDRSYRKEDSEMRTHPDVVNDRYKGHYEEIMKISKPMSIEFLPTDNRKKSTEMSTPVSKNFRRN